MEVFGLLSSVFDIDVILNHPSFQRTRTIKCIGSNDVAEMVGLHFLKQVTDAAALQLEDAFGFTPLQQGESCLIIQRKFQWVDRLSPRLLDHVHGKTKDGQVAKPQKVHFQQSGVFNVTH